MKTFKVIDKFGEEQYISADNVADLKHKITLLKDDATHKDLLKLINNQNNFLINDETEAIKGYVDKSKELTEFVKSHTLTDDDKVLVDKRLKMYAHINDDEHEHINELHVGEIIKKEGEK